MRKLARSLFISLVAFYIVAQFIPGIGYNDRQENLLLVSFTFAVMTLFVRPLLKTLLLPFNLLTLGALGTVINLGFVFLLSVILPFFTIGSFAFGGAEVLGFLIPAFSSTPLITAALLSTGVSLISSLLHYLLS